jgi:hypothetical protein
MEQADAQKKKFINEKDSTFLTGTNIKKDFNIASLIPISHTDVHKFI